MIWFIALFLFGVIVVWADITTSENIDWHDDSVVKCSCEECVKLADLVHRKGQK